MIWLKNYVRLSLARLKSVEFIAKNFANIIKRVHFAKKIKLRQNNFN